jgi:hypothetical protein
MMVWVMNLFQDWCFQSILGAPTSVDVGPQESSKPPLGAVVPMDRRVSEMARRVSASVISFAQAKKKNFRARVRNTFFGEETIRAIPDSVEVNRALAAMSITRTNSVGSLRQSMALATHGDAASDVESGSVRSQRFSRLRYASTTSGTILTSRNISITPQMSTSHAGPFDVQYTPDYAQLRIDLQGAVDALPESAEKDYFVSEWG